MSNIEWTQETWNPVVGCTRVSAGCDHCYAVGMTHRLGAMAENDLAAAPPRDPGKKAAYMGLTVLNPRGDRHFNGVVRCVEEALDIPLRWKKPRTIFVNSMGDLFHEKVPFGFIMRVLSVTARTPWHTYQILTKRPERMAEFWAMWNDLSGEDFGAFKNARGPDAVRKAHPSGRGELFAQMLESMGDPPPGAAYPTFDWAEGMIGWGMSHFGNLWLGTSCENQEEADERIPHLLRCPAAVRFLSCEPLIGGIDLLIDGECSSWRCPECGSRGVDPEGAGGGDDFSSWACGDCGAVGDPGADAEWKPEIDWVIVGGESGPNARPCDIAWIRSIVGECKDANVPVFVKQLGASVRVKNDRFDEWPNGGDGLIYDAEGPGWDYQGEDVIVRTHDKKGGDMAEWPEDLRAGRVREMPGDGMGGDTPLAAPQGEPTSGGTRGGKEGSG